MHGDTFTRLLALPVIHRLGALYPRREIPREVSGVYARSLHRDYLGEWDFDLEWKPLASWPVYAGWIRAIRTGQARIARGLEIESPGARGQLRPVRRIPTSVDDPDLMCTDVVLDVERMRRRAAQLSRHVTIAQVHGRDARRGALPRARPDAGVRRAGSLALGVRRPLTCPRAGR